MVSGVAALIASVKPDVTQDQMRALLCAGADDEVGDPAEDTPGFDIYYGWGRLNAYNSLVLALTRIDPVTVTLIRKSSWPGTVLPTRAVNIRIASSPQPQPPDRGPASFLHQHHLHRGRAFWTNDTPVTATNPAGQFYRVSVSLE